MTSTDVASTRNTGRRSLAASLALLTAFVTPGLARAESTADAAAARALFAEGRKLLEQGKFSEACPKFQESLRLKPGIGTRFNLADCWDKSGRTASAWGEFLEVATAAKAQGQKDRETVARDRARALEAKLSYLVIETEESDPELRVTRDGAEVGRGMFGTAVPVDPGAHAIEASSPTKKPWSVSEEVKVGQKSRVLIPKLAPRDAEPATSTGSTPQTPITGGPGNPPPGGTPPADSPQDSGSSGGGFGVQRAVGLGIAGLGVAGIAVGAVFMAGYGSKNDEAKKVCPTGTCSSDEIAQHDRLIEEAKDKRTLSYVGFGAGGALLVAGTVIFFTAPSNTKSARVNVIPVASRHMQGLVVTGRF